MSTRITSIFRDSNVARARVAQWIHELIQAYHQYGVGSRPACKLQKRVHSTRSHKW